MNTNKNKRLHRISRHKRVRAKILGTKERPRIAVFKSNQYIYAQVVDDESGKTLLGVSDKPRRQRVGVPTKASGEVQGGKKSDKALKIGETLAVLMKEKGLFEAVFDRGGFKFHGRVKSVADGLRSGGIKF